VAQGGPLGGLQDRRRSRHRPRRFAHGKRGNEKQDGGKLPSSRPLTPPQPAKRRGQPEHRHQGHRAAGNVGHRFGLHRMQRKYQGDPASAVATDVRGCRCFFSKPLLEFPG